MQGAHKRLLLDVHTGVCIYRLLWVLENQRSVGARSAVDGNLVTEPTFALREDVMS